MPANSFHFSTRHPDEKTVVSRFAGCADFFAASQPVRADLLQHRHPPSPSRLRPAPAGFSEWKAKGGLDAAAKATPEPRHSRMINRKQVSLRGPFTSP
jgi:hypothetical protein